MTAAAIVLCLPMTRSVAEDHLTLADDPKPAEIHDAIERHPLDYFGYAVAAQQLAAAHNPNAVPMLNHALRLHPTHSGLHRFAARLLLNAGHTDQAALELASALRATSDPRSTISDIDHMLPPDQAAQAIPVDYDNVELVTHTLVQDGRSDVALTWITKVVAQQPKGLAAIDMMYSLAMSRGNVAAAEQAMRARLAASASPRTTLQLAQLLAKRHANNDIVKLLADVPRWHGLIEDQVSAWLLLCDTQLELGDLDETTRCLRRLDVAGILGAGQRNEITTRLDEIARRRKDAALLERVKDASQPRPADPK
jgi:predicted Zn-dependent protease